MEYIITFGIGNISELCATVRLKKPRLPLADPQLGNLPRPSETGRVKRAREERAWVLVATCLRLHSCCLVKQKKSGREWGATQEEGSFF